MGELRLSSERQARKAWLHSKRSRDSTAQMAGGQAEKAKDLSDHRGFFDGGDDLHITAAVRTVFDVDIEHPITKTLPGFRPSGRRSPFKTAPDGFVSKRAQLMRVADGW